MPTRNKGEAKGYMGRKDTSRSIFRSGLKRRTLLLTAVLMLIVIATQFALSFIFLNAAFDENVERARYGFDTNIKTAVETLVSALDASHKMYAEGLIDEQAAMEMAQNIVRDTRYNSGAGEEGDGYFWADAADGYCVAHYNPAQQGQMRWDAQDQEGTYLVREFIAQGDAGGGYSDFYFGKPGDEGGSYLKRGYTLKYEPYGWYISTGNYYEDIDRAIGHIQETHTISLAVLFATSLITAFIGLYLVAKNLNRMVVPIIKISDRVHQLSMGDTSTGSFAVTDQDEIGELHAGVLKVVDILNRLIEGINVMIAEHEKGNIDYGFDTEGFKGNYKILANSVLELAAFGMRDQLTGLPNRRSFNSRLELEWSRATRDKRPISLLMIDVDKFKDYNDTFGHQQGDAALQAVAKAIGQTLNRAVDFCARWGGEEFIVLLPATDAPGARSVAEAVRRAVERTLILREDGQETRVTISVGASTRIPAADAATKDFISEADAALYRAKASGRNQVALWEKGDDKLM